MSRDNTGTVLGGRIDFSVTPPGGYNDDKMSKADIQKYIAERHAEDKKCEETQNTGD